MLAVRVQDPFPYPFKSLNQERTYNVKDHAHKLRYPLCRSLRSRRFERREKVDSGRTRSAKSARGEAAGGGGGVPPPFSLVRGLTPKFPSPSISNVSLRRSRSTHRPDHLYIQKARYLRGRSFPPPPPPQKLLSLQYISNYWKHHPDATTLVHMKNSLPKDTI